MDSFLESLPKDVVQKAFLVKALLFDVDGVLTDGKIVYVGDDSEIKEFHVRDGQIIRPLQEAGVLVGIITGRASEAVKRRASELSIDVVKQGVKNKLECLEDVLEKYGLAADEIAYIGDDYPDVPVMKNCLLGISPADAPIYIREVSDYVTMAKGGEGVVREVADIILMAKEKHPFG